MLKRTLVLVVTLILASVGAFSSPYMGITIGAESYMSGTQLTFSNVADDIQYAVGSYSWTQVNGTWYGAHEPADPGLGWNNVHYKWDAMGLFFQPTANQANFLIIAGMPPTGTMATELGYGSRQFGPGDLKIDVGSTNYGIGIRQGGLFWGTDIHESRPWFQIHTAEGPADIISARDAGTKGIVEQNPQWDHVDNHLIPAYSDNAYAFYRHGSGPKTGDATVTATDTGVTLANYPVYAYEVSVPWAALGLDPDNYSFTASWRPDCGNDIIQGSFSGSKEEQPPVPEASTLMLGFSGLSAVAFGRRRRK